MCVVYAGHIVGTG